MLVIRSVTEADTGQYLCTVQTYPPHNIIVRVTVTGEAFNSQRDFGLLGPSPAIVKFFASFR